MSDAQPRKRKNKGKKKEENAEEDIFTPLKNSTDQVIHVHKDVGLGGNVFTKLIFFGLLATIGVMVGVILLEYRGASEEETHSAEDSPWAVRLEKWVEDSHHAHEAEHEEKLHPNIYEEKEHEEEMEERGDNDRGPTDEGGSSLLNWFGFGGGKETDEVLESSEDGLPVSNNFISFLWFGGNEEDESVVEETGEGGWFGFFEGEWFGFGSEEKSAVEDAEEPEEGQEETDEYEQEEESEEYEPEKEEDENDLEKEWEEEDELEREEEEDEELEREENELEREEDEEELDRDEEEELETEEKEEDEFEREQAEEADDSDRGKEEDSKEELKGSKNVRKYSEEEEEDDTPLEDQAEWDEDKVSKEEWDKEEEDYSFSGEEDKKLDEDEEVGDDELEAEDVSPQISFGKSGKEDDEREEDSGKEESDEELDEEELFPEALEALRREREELAKKKEERKVEMEDEGYVDSSIDITGGAEEETEGMALKFGVGVALVVVAHVVLVKKWNSWAGEDGSEVVSEGEVTTEWKTEEPVSHPPVTPITLAPDPHPGVEDESPVEEEEIDEEESEPEIDKDKFKELLAKYGQETPESSELSDNDGNIHDYSEGEESGGDEAEDSPGVSEDDPGESEDDPGESEDDLKEWTGLKKSDLDKIAKLESGSELEEEDSVDEPTQGPLHQENEFYPNDLITNKEDWAIREELDRADQEFNYEKAQSLFSQLLEKHPDSPRARHGLAVALDRLAEQRRSNHLLQISIKSYLHALNAPDIPQQLFITIASRLINRLRFRGLHSKAVEIHNQLILRFPDTPEYKIDLAITYLMINNLENARVVLKEVLKSWPEDPIALSHYGLVLKLQGNTHGCIKYLEQGLAMDFPATRDARLYFHLGDALARVGREPDAHLVYDKAVAYGLFRSRYQRSLYNVDHLTGRPWWTHQQTTYASFFKSLEANWEQIRKEGVKALNLNGLYEDEAENLRDTGDWKQFQLFARGAELKSNCKTTPLTCSLIRRFDPAAKCKRGQSKFSVMEGGTHVWPHCGPTNCRLRAHLGLIVPEGPRIRVANITRTWEEGKLIVFDDSFEHEVWHEGTSLRLILIVDVWHPELTREEILSLSPI